MARDIVFDNIGNAYRNFHNEEPRRRPRRIDPVTMEYIVEEGEFAEEIEETRIEKIRADLDRRINTSTAKDYHVITKNVKDFKFSRNRRYIPAPNVVGAVNYKRHSRTVNFYNNTGKTLTVVYRDNVKVELPPQTGIKPSLTFASSPTEKELSGLVVEVTDSIPAMCINPYMFSSVSVSKVLGDEIADKMLEEISAVDKPLLGDITTEVSFNYYHIIDGGFISNKSTVYDRELDILVYVGNSVNAPDHPANDTEVVTAFYNGLGETVECSSVVFDIVDNDDTIAGKRYVYAGGQVVTIPVRKDPSKENGLHVITRVGTKVNAEVVEIGKFADFGVYKSKEEALTAGDPSLIHKERVQKLIKETEELKAENNKLSETIKGRLQEAELEFQKEKNLIEREHKETMLKLRKDLEEMKAKYEAEKLERQAKIEKLTFANNVLKGLVAVTTAALGMVVLIYRNTTV